MHTTGTGRTQVISHSSIVPAVHPCAGIFELCSTPTNGNLQGRLWSPGSEDSGSNATFLFTGDALVDLESNRSWSWSECKPFVVVGYSPAKKATITLEFK